jgi:penicillin-binding protein 2A
MKKFFIILFIMIVGFYMWVMIHPYELNKEDVKGTEYVTLEEMPDELKRAFVETEDARFYHHIGIDPIGIVRAFYRGAKEGELKEGASTITQQVARNIYLNQDRTAKRKIKEIFIALNINYHNSKNEILETYVNDIYFGSGAYGIGEAARTYFDKDVKELTVPEMALLAGLPQAPSAYDPTVHMKLAKERRNIVLGILAKKELITPEQEKKYAKEPIRLHVNKKSDQH